MKKKKSIIIICSVVVFVLILSTVIFIGVGKSAEKELYSSYYTLDEDFIIEAENGCLSQKKNTLEFIKTAYNSGANCVELDLTFDNNGDAFIESDPDNINDGTLKLETVMKMLSEDALYQNSMLDLKVNSNDNLPLLDELCKKYDLSDRVFLTGINVNQSMYIKHTCSLPFYLTMDLKYSEDNAYITEVFNEISISTAVGIVSTVDKISPLLKDVLTENWIKISFENISNKKECIKALKMSPGRIKTDKPYEVLEIVQNWQNSAPAEFYGIEETTV